MQVRLIWSVYEQHDYIGLTLRSQLCQQNRDVMIPLRKIWNGDIDGQRSIDTVEVVHIIRIGRNHVGKFGHIRVVLMEQTGRCSFYVIHEGMPSSNWITWLNGCVECWIWLVVYVAR